MKRFKRAISIVLSLAMLFASLQLSAYALSGHGEKVSSMTFATMSDTHFYPESLMGDKGEEWQEFCRLESKMYNESEQIIRAALDSICERMQKSDGKYILVPGDLSKDSEYEAHKRLAEIFEKYESKYNVDFLVINGNHDINTTRACTFENGKKQPTRAITYKEFKEVYKNLGYDLAFDEFAPNDEEIHGALSYCADLDGGYRLIVVDSNIYSFTKPDKDKTGGYITPELMQWIKEMVDGAKEKGFTPLLMIHHNMAPHMEVEPSIAFAFPLENYLEVSEQLADWGLHYAFTGHLHTTDTACVVNDNGEVLYDIETSSITGFPNQYRECTISTYADGESELRTTANDFDCDRPFTLDGVTYEKGEYKYKSFDLCFGGGLSKDGKADVTSFLIGIVKNYVGGYIEQIIDGGGILPFLKTMGIDLEEIIAEFLKPYIGDGFKIGSLSILSADNLIWFIDDLCDQISKLYLENPQNLYDLLTPVLDELFSMEVADVPCTRFIETYGFGDKRRNGTLADAVLSAMIYYNTGNESMSNDLFMQETIDKLENGDTASRIFYKLVDLLLHDVIEDGILAKLEIRADKLLADSAIQRKMGEGINYLLNYVLRGDFTYMNLVNTVFALGILPYSDLYDVLDGLLLSKYLTESQLESIGIFIAYILTDFSTDSNPFLGGDSGVAYYSMPLEAEATRKNYRLPTMVSVTLGEDSQSEATINWFSKYSLTSTDIEIYKSKELPSFSGIDAASKGITAEKQYKAVSRSFPGIDLGVIGILNYEFGMAQHTVKLSGLEKGETYFYRVGNAEYGWWSETGKLTVPDGGKKTTFFHMTDPQSQNDRQYNRAWVNVLKNAFKMYPDAGFIMNTGDLVDHGDNNKQWQAMFDNASPYLMNTFMMPTSGNHEGMGTNATANYFVLPNAPEQDTATGVYYSYDYNNVHFAVLNSNDLDEKTKALSNQQIEWLKDDMSKSKAQWKLVAVHKAPYSQGSHYSDDDVCAIRTQLSSLMPELGIDMVFTGHDHVYLRTASLIANQKAQTKLTYLQRDGEIYKTQVQPIGTSYVITGCAGVKSYIQNDVSKTDKYFPRGEKIISLDMPMFAAVEIEDGVLYFNAYGVNGDNAQNIDRFAIQKDLSQGEVAEDYEAAEETVIENEAESTVAVFIKYILKILTLLFNIYEIYFAEK